MINKILESECKEELNQPQLGFLDWPDAEDLEGQEEFDIASAIWEAHDDPC